MKKILLLIAVFFLASQISFGQSTGSDNQWLVIKYDFYSGPVSPQYQKTYSVTVNNDRSAQVSYRQGMEKTGPQIESFTVSKTNMKKLTSAIKKLGILEGVNPSDSSDGKIGGPTKSITVTYGSTNPNLDQPVRQTTFKETGNSSKEVTKLFDLMEKIFTKTLRKKLEQKETPK